MPPLFEDSGLNEFSKISKMMKEFTRANILDQFTLSDKLRDHFAPLNTISKMNEALGITRSKSLEDIFYPTQLAALTRNPSDLGLTFQTEFDKKYRLDSLSKAFEYTSLAQKAMSGFEGLDMGGRLNLDSRTSKYFTKGFTDLTETYASLLNLENQFTASKAWLDYAPTAYLQTTRLISTLTVEEEEEVLEPLVIERDHDRNAAGKLLISKKSVDEFMLGK